MQLRSRRKEVAMRGGRSPRILGGGLVLMSILSRTGSGLQDPAADRPGSASVVRVASLPGAGDSVHPSLAVASNGDLVAVFSMGGRLARDQRLCRSKDGGETWSPPAPLDAFGD